MSARQRADRLWNQLDRSVPAPLRRPVRRRRQGMLARLRARVPYLANAEGRDMMARALAGYPFTPAARRVLAKRTRLRGTSHQLRRGAKTAGESGETFAHDERSRLANLLRLKTRVNVGDRRIDTTAHELLHVLNTNRGKIGTASHHHFNRAWEKAKRHPKHGRLPRLIDRALRADPEYSHDPHETSPVGTADERFAYLGATVGHQGRRAIPQPLRHYYRNTFRGGSSSR